jgi:hypothetical protein
VLRYFGRLADAPPKESRQLRRTGAGHARNLGAASGLHPHAGSRRRDDSYFAPLKSFKAPDTKIYLGVIHHMDDQAEFTRLVSAAAHNIADFGVAAPCGFGRQPQSVAGLLNDHLGALALLQDHTARQKMEA